MASHWVLMHVAYLCRRMHCCIWGVSSFGALVVVWAAWKNQAEDVESSSRRLGGSSPF